MQPLLFPPDLSSLPTDQWCYVPSLLNRQGELEALREVSASVWEHMMPLLHIAPQKRKGEGPLRRDTVREWVKKLSRAVGEQPFYLDVRGIAPTAPVELVGHQEALLSHLFALARKRHVRALPVCWVGKSSEAHLDMLKTAAQVDQLGIALRFSFANVALPVGMTRTQMLAKCLDDLECDISMVDLLLDLGYLDPDEDYEPGNIAESIDEMSALGSWRSIVLLGSSIPKTLSCVPEGTVGPIPRGEWILWTQLAAFDLKRFPAFGDYCHFMPDTAP
jgi:Beta protein